MIEAGEDRENQVISIGDNQSVSMQTVQDIYNEFTGKSEEISKSYRLHHKTCFEDIEQLNLKIEQLREQYNIIEKNCNVTLYHVDDCKEVFSTFQRFRLYDKSSLSSIENVHLQYNFLILLPKINRPQHYKIEIDIHSRAAIKQKSKIEHGIHRRIMNIIATRTAVLEIEYIDYTVARNFRTTIDSWFNGLEASEPHKLLNIAQDNSHHFALISRYLSAAFIFAFFYANSAGWVDGGLTLLDIFKLSILCFGAVYIISGIAARFGSEMARAIDKIQPLSYLKLNRGDEKAISELTKSNNANKWKTFSALVVTVVLNLISVWVSAKLGIGM